MENNKVVDFINFFKTHTHLQSKDALKIYDREFQPKLVPEYFEGWTYWEDDSEWNDGKFLKITDSKGYFRILIFHDNHEYWEKENQYTNKPFPKTFGDFISDILRGIGEEFQLLFTKKAMNIIYG